MNNRLALLRAKCARLHHSATVWFNGVAGVAVFALPQLRDQVPQLQGYIPEKWYHYVMGALIIGNIILRFKTSKPLQER
jgi:cytochrome b561